MKSITRTALVLALGLGIPALAQAPVSLNIADVATAKLGFQGQFQFQSNTDPVMQGTSNNFVIRRLRLIAGGTVGDKIDWLVDTDQPKTGQVTSNLNGAKLNEGGYTAMYIQDAVMTYKFCPGLYLDGGILTIDPNHHGLTSSARFLGNDLSTYASQQNTPLTNTVARDVGLSARGLVGDHFEYHLGVTNGLRDTANNGLAAAAVPTSATATSTMSSNNALRVTLRGQYDLFDNEGAGYTTAGTYFGHKKIVSFGLGYDHQDTYKQTTGDVFVDLPVNGGNVFTFEGNYWVYDGGSFLPSLLKQKDWSMQVGYLFKDTHFAPVLRLEQKRYDDPGTTNAVDTSGRGTGVSTTSATTVNGNLNEDRQCIGFAYYMKEQRANLKLFYNNIKPKNVTNGAFSTGPVQNSYHQITAQLQILAW